MDLLDRTRTFSFVQLFLFQLRLRTQKCINDVYRDKKSINLCTCMLRSALCACVRQVRLHVDVRERMCMYTSGLKDTGNSLQERGGQEEVGTRSLLLSEFCHS